VIALDPDRGVATLAGGGEIRFRRALLATGAEPLLPPIPGISRALPLRTLGDARRLRAAAIAAGPGARVAIIGGGFIGVEVASSLASLGLRPTIIERATALWSGSLGASLSDWAVARLASAGVDVRLGEPATGIDGSGVLVGEHREEAAIVVVGAGVRPRVDVAVAAGLDLDDGIVTDGAGRTSHPAVWAAGDVARVDGQRVEHWHAAREAGERVARSLLGAHVDAVPVPWVFSEVTGVGVDVVGAPDPAAEERRFGEAVVTWLRDGRAVGIAVVGGAMTAAEARSLVASGASAVQVERSVEPSGA
jgi:NADPH-dependent 2,4-dienoyl-CoA reductase/sulfur reductase-like enzyme